MKNLKEITAKAGAVSVMTVLALGLGNSAQAALLGPGRIDLTSLNLTGPDGFLLYTSNAIDFTSQESAPGIPLTSPPTLALVNVVNPAAPGAPGGSGFAVAGGSGSFATALGNSVRLADLWSPAPISTNPGAPTVVPGGAELFSINLTAPAATTATFVFDSVFRTPATDTGSLTLEFTGRFISNNGAFDPTPATFSILTAQVPFPVSSTPTLSLAQFTSTGIPVLGTAPNQNFSSWSGTFIVPAQVVPEPSSVVGLAALTILAPLGLRRGLGRRKENK